MKKTIAIVGATGRVGSKTASILLEKGHRLRLVARHEDKLIPYKQKGAAIFPGDSLDAKFLADVFKGIDAAFVMMPADYTADDVGAYQDRMGNAQIEAIKSSGVKNVLFLSSVGGHTEVNTGIVPGLARQEKRLNALQGVNVLILRPSYFMENLMGNIGLIKSMGINGSPIRADVRFPIIATQDIANVAAAKLDALDWQGKTVLPLLGPRDYSMAEVTRVLGKAIGKPDLPYVQFPDDQAKQGMMQQIGVSASAADAFIGLSKGINLGVFNTEKRNAATTTPTSIEEFSKMFAEAYRS